jgi:hypothetical protein
MKEEKKVLDYGHFLIPLTKHLLTRDRILSLLLGINILFNFMFFPFPINFMQKNSDVVVVTW